MGEYSVLDLSKMFKVSRNTIYARLNSSDLTPYTTKSEQGLRLNKEGFNVLQLMLSDSKVNISKHVKSTPSVHLKLNTNDTDVNMNNEDMNTRYINLLFSQIEDLKREKAEIQSKYDVLVNMFIEQQPYKLLEDRQAKEKRSLFKWFKR